MTENQSRMSRLADISSVFARFPVPVALMGMFTIILMFFDSFGAFKEHIAFLALGLIAAAYACVNIVLAREVHGRSPLLLLQFGLSLGLAVLAWFSESLRTLVPFIVGAGILLLGNMVRWGKDRDDLHTWDFTHKIWTGAIFATAGSIIYLLGILAIMAALKSLFGIDIEKLMERLLLPIGLGFLAPLYWLSTVPPVDEDASELYDNPSFVSKAVAFLGTWLLSPLTMIYALILVTYGLKIILMGELPKGEIAALTTPFLIVGTATWLVLDPPFVREKPLAKLFRKAWFFLSIPAALLLAVAVSVRIGTYGLTWERIGLLMCVIWAVGLGLWFTIGPKLKRDIRLIPGCAAVLMLVMAFAAQPLSFQNQKGRAIDGLKEAGIMTSAGVIKPQDEIVISDENAARKAKGALQYLQRNDGWDAIEMMFKDAEDRPTDAGKMISKLYDRLALSDVQLGSKSRGRYQNYYNEAIKVDIAGFKTLSGPYILNSRSNLAVNANKVDAGFSFKSNESEITFLHEDIEVASFDVFEWVESHSVSDHQIIIDDPYIDVLDSEGRRLKMIIMNANMSRQNENSGNTRVEFYLLSSGFN